MFRILGQGDATQRVGHAAQAVDPAVWTPDEPPHQRDTFERLADWIFTTSRHGRRYLIRSFPFNVLEISAFDWPLVDAHFKLGTPLPAELLSLLHQHHFFDGEPDPDKYLTSHVSAILLVTTACNLECSGCFASGGDYGLGSSKMTHGTAERTVHYLEDKTRRLYGEGYRGEANLGLHFFGGEPFIAFDVVEHATQSATSAAGRLSQELGRVVRPDFFITTNGTLMRPERIAFLERHNFSVLISIDGPSHDERRRYASGRGSLSKAIDAFKALRKASIKVRLNTVVLGSDVKDFDATLNWFRQSVYDDAPDLNLYHTFSFQREGPNGALGDCSTKYDSAQIGEYTGSLLDFSSAGYQTYEVQLRKKMAVGGTFYKCSSGFKRIAVGPDGTVYPCQGFIDRSFEMGKITDLGFDHLQSDVSQQLRRRTIATLRPCRNCVFSALCPHNVDCAARAHYTLGGLNIIDTSGMCRIGFTLMDHIIFEQERLWIRDGKV